MLKTRLLKKTKKRDGKFQHRFPVGIITHLLWVKFMDDGYHINKMCVSDGFKEIVFCPRKQINLDLAKRYLTGRNFLDINDFNTSDVRGWGF